MAGWSLHLCLLMYLLSFCYPRPKSSATASQGKRQQAKSDTMKESSDVVRSAPYSVMPGGMTVKKTDLLTR